MTASRKKLRPSQRKVCEDVWNAFSNRGVRRGIVALPTGFGKTFTAASFVTPVLDQLTGTCLWVAHRMELLDQAATAFREVAPHLKITRWDAKIKDSSGDVVLAMIGSTRTLKRKFLMVVIDEAHHAAEDIDDYTNMYAKLFKQIEWSHALGLTATPERLDGRDLAFDEIISAVTFLDAVRMHRLSRPIYVEMLTNQSHVLQTRGGEFTKRSLRRLDNPKRNFKIAEEYVKNKEMYGKTLMFVTGIDHCYNMKAEIERLDPTAVVGIVHGTSPDRKFPKKVREAVLEWFNEGPQTTQKILLNCEVYTEGYDCPSIKSIFLGRPTLSKSLWMQMTGRGARIIVEDYIFTVDQIVAREPAGSDGVEQFTFNNGAVYYGEDLGTIGDDERGVALHHIVLHMDDEFYLVQIMDDITKFHALIQEWQLEVREMTPEELEEQELSSILEEKRLALHEIQMGNDVEMVENTEELGDAKIRDLVGLLVISTFFQKNMGIPCDFERQVVLKRLHDFAYECVTSVPVKVSIIDPDTGMITGYKDDTQEVFDAEKYKDLAFTNCVIAGEFPAAVFDKIRVAFYFNFIRGMKMTKFRSDGRLYTTWDYKPLVDITPESRSHLVEAAAKMEKERRLLNSEFNEEFDTRKKWQDLYERVKKSTYDHIAEDTKKPKTTRTTLRNFFNKLSVVRVQDRKISLYAEYEVDTANKAGRLAYIGRLLTRGMQMAVDDPNCIVTISPRRTSWDSKGKSVGAEKAV